MRTPVIRRGVAAVKAGFTLIELLAVILIISILMTYLIPKIPEYIDTAESTACRANMGEIYKGFTVYQIKHKRAPNESGVRFFAKLITHKVWENSESSAQRLTCPGVDRGALAIGDLDPEEWFSDLDVLDGSYSSYAGRDCDNYPLRKFPGSNKIVIVADDNDGGMNHLTTTNALYAGGFVGTFELATLQLDGILDEEEDLLLVGPESPVEELTKLSLD